MDARLRHISIIRQQQQAFGVIVQPADRKDPHSHFRHQIRDRRPAIRIVHRRHVTGWFMQENKDFGLGRLHVTTIDLHVIFRRIDTRSQDTHDFAVHRDVAFPNHGFSRAPGSDPTSGNNFL